MSPKVRVRIVDAAVICLVGYFVVSAAMHRSPKPPKSAFDQNINLEPLRKVAVHDVGRIKSFDSYARSIISAIAGPRGIDGQSAVYSYMDLMLNRPAYRDRNIIYVKKAIRPAMARVMEHMDVEPDYIATFLKRGKISESVLLQQPMIEEIRKLDTDVIRTSKFVNMVETAYALSDPHELSARWVVVPPPGGDDQSQWLAGQRIWGLDFLGDGHNHAAAKPIEGLDPALRAELTAAFTQLAEAWQGRDAEQANAAIVTLAEGLRQIEPRLYPELDKLELESFYFRYKAFVWNWLIYLLASIPLLLSVIYRWRGAYRAGAALLLVAFAIHTASLGIRWYLAGRIPNSNMFEAVLAATWFGVAGAYVLEFLVRKTAMRGLFFLGSAVCAMVAMMCQHFLPTALRADIDNVMPVLDDLWLYIHTNVIIWSYALIGMAAITGLLYLRYRVGGGDPAVARAGGAGSLILDGAPSKRDSFLQEDNRATVGQVLDAATMVTMELSFIMLWAGTVMGAIWADHSWGRPWGWDPKEVFALCTFVIFLILVHVRFKVRDKGLWTAILAVVGCGVMLFNWIVINFKIQGLHSYA